MAMTAVMMAMMMAMKSGGGLARVDFARLACLACLLCLVWSL